MMEVSTKLLFNVVTGELIPDTGNIVPIPPITYLKDVLLTEPFPFKVGDFRRRERGEWSDDEVIIIGRQVVDSLAEEEEPPVLTTNTFRHLDVLGILPGINYIKWNFGSISEYRQKIGGARPRPSSDYDSLTQHELILKLRDIFAETGIVPPVSVEKLRILGASGLAPNYDYLHNRFGGIGNVNELFGIPNYRSWDTYDAIAFGADLIEKYGSKVITAKAIGALASQKLSPYPQFFRKFFAHWPDYRQASMELVEKRRDEKAALMHAIDKHFQTTIYALPEEINAQMRARIYGIYILVRRLLPNEPEESVKKLSLTTGDSFVRTIIKKDQSITAGEIETMAETLRVFDAIWDIADPTVLMPEPEKDDYEYVDEDETFDK